MLFDGHDAVLRRNNGTYIDMPFIRGSEGEIYTSHLASIVRNELDLDDAVSVNHTAGDSTSYDFWYEKDFRFKKLAQWFDKKFRPNVL